MIAHSKQMRLYCQITLNWEIPGMWISATRFGWPGLSWPSAHIPSCPYTTTSSNVSTKSLLKEKNFRKTWIKLYNHQSLRLKINMPISSWSFLSDWHSVGVCHVSLVYVSLVYSQDTCTWSSCSSDSQESQNRSMNI